MQYFTYGVESTKYRGQPHFLTWCCSPANTGQDIVDPDGAQLVCGQLDLRDPDEN